MKLIMLKGLPGSGKSTWALAEVAAGGGKVVRVNRDAVRLMLHGQQWAPKFEDLVTVICDQAINTALGNGKTVLVDETALNPDVERRLRTLAALSGAQFEIRDFTGVPLETCIANDLKRPASVGKDVIVKMYRKYLAPAPLSPPAWDVGLPDAVIVDVDGTLAHMVDRGPYDATKYDTDRFDAVVAELALICRARGDKIIVCSGRDDTYRFVTEAWMRRHGFAWDLFLMRAAGDRRNDAIVKQELYENHIKDQYNVLFVLDDRNRVVEMWRQQGLRCLQVADGDF